MKDVEQLSVKVASALRRRFIVHEQPNDVRYVLIVSQDVGFLWDERHALADDAAPSLVFPMGPVVWRYFPTAAREPRFFGSGLEFIVAQWLSDLASDIVATDGVPERLLSEVGFVDALRGARVAFPVAA